jgi:hypothetical protein
MMKLSIVATADVKMILEELIIGKIPIQASWKLKKIAYKFDEHYRMYETSRNDLVKKYAIVDEEGKLVTDEKGGINVDPTKMDAFIAEHKELLDIDIDMPTVSIKELGDKLEIEAKKLIILGDIIVD